MDSASAEYQFLKGFFGVEDSSLFDEEFKDVCKYVWIFGIPYFVVQYKFWIGHLPLWIYLEYSW